MSFARQFEGPQMRQAVHDSAISIRLNEALAARALAKAEREGMTLSELIRHAVRRELREVN